MSTIKSLLEEKKALVDRLEKIDKAIKAFQDVCLHKDEEGKDTMECVGSDSHKDHYKCTICQLKMYI